MILTWQYTTIYNIEEWLSSRGNGYDYTTIHKTCLVLPMVLLDTLCHVHSQKTCPTNRIVIYEKDYVSFQWYRVVVVPSYYDVCEE